MSLPGRRPWDGVHSTSSWWLWWEKQGGSRWMRENSGSLCLSASCERKNGGGWTGGSESLRPQCVCDRGRERLEHRQRISDVPCWEGVSGPPALTTFNHGLGAAWEEHHGLSSKADPEAAVVAGGQTITLLAPERWVPSWRGIRAAYLRGCCVHPWPCQHKWRNRGWHLVPGCHVRCSFCSTGKPTRPADHYHVVSNYAFSCTLETWRAARFPRLERSVWITVTKHRLLWRMLPWGQQTTAPIATNNQFVWFLRECHIACQAPYLGNFKPSGQK